MKNNISKNLIEPIFNFINKKEYDQALSQLKELLKKNQDTNLIFKIIGSIYINKKEWKKAIIYYSKISKERINFEISNNLGVALYKLGKFSEASIRFQEAINYKKSYLPAYENFCITNKLLGNYNLSLKYSLNALKLNPSSNKIKNNLIDILNYFIPNDNENSILQANSQILKLNLENNKNKFIKIPDLKKIINKSHEIIENNGLFLNYPHTQIFKKNTLNYECERHLQIFAEQKIIPKFCFSCYKVQITLNNVLELLRLYFYFNKLNLNKNNIRKCIVELRNNVTGNYKGYVFCKSIAEAENIKKIINNDFSSEKISINKIEIKHGCTEYYEEFKVYKNIKDNVEDKIYQNKWKSIEKAYDERNLILENNRERVFNNTIKLFNLPDFLIIKNWLIYARIIGDKSYKKIINFDPNIKNLSKLEIQKINVRKKYLIN